MNTQIRKLFTVTLALFLILGVAATLIQFVYASDLVNDSRNTRRYLQALERDRGPIIVADVPIALSEKIEPANTYQRTYPEGELYAAITGYFSAVNMVATGMEAAENNVLEGRTDLLFQQRIRNLFAGQQREGGGVDLTIDPAMQETAQRLLGDREGAVVALNTETGAVLALYSSPSYDPNPLASLDATKATEAAEALEADPRRPLDNRAIASNRYAPGSTFKILTAVAMLENGVTPTTKIPSPSTTILPGTATEISNIYGSSCGDGTPTFTEAFARSCNTAFVIASEGLPDGALADVTERFGFGESLKIPLSVTPSTFPQDMDAAQLAMSAIGQFEVQVTPLQMAMVAAAIANDGTMMQPYLVDSVVDADNRRHSKTSPRELRQAVVPEIAEQVKAMMVEAVSGSGASGSAAQVPGIQVAAKTGTAEVGDGSRTNAWTVGFAPADDPQIAVAVIVEGSDTNPNPLGGSVAAPILSQLLEVGLK